MTVQLRTVLDPTLRIFLSYATLIVGVDTKHGTNEVIILNEAQTIMMLALTFKGEILFILNSG